MANDRLEHFALVERTNNGSDHVHQFEVLPFHVASEQALRIRSEFKKSAVKLVSELSTDRPDRVERLSDKLSLFRRHDGNRRNSRPSGIRALRSRPRHSRSRSGLLPARASSISAGYSHLARRLSGPALKRMRECAHLLKAEQPRNL